MAAAISIGTLIESTPGTCSGRPRLAGTRIRVSLVARLTNHGMSPEEIAAEYEHLTLAQIHAGLAYYYANRDEIDDEIREDDELVDRAYRESLAKDSLGPAA